MNRRVSSLLAAALLCLAPVVAASPPSADVRLIVDVSASMGRTDPDNERGTALGALLRLLPEDGQAGVWTYGKYVNMLVKYADSTALWKENAAILTADLESVGRRSDLLEAVDRASWDRGRADGPADLILLTDGRLDVSDEAGINAAQRRRLLGELAPELAAAGYRVHSLALSDQADAELLGQLAALTGGYHGVIETADDLPAGLVDLLGWIAGPAEVPLAEQGSFQVAPGTGSLTVLRLGAQLDEPLALVDPAGTRLVRTTPRTRVRWHVDDGYELITLAEPAPGTWRFEGPRGRARIYAYGDLRARYADLPGTLFPDDLRSFELTLVSDGSVVEDGDFLSLLDISARLHGSEGSRPVVVEPGAGGRFTVNLLGPEAAGEYVLETRVWGPTFEQTLSLPLVLKNPLAIEVHPAEDGFVMWVRVGAADLDHDSLRLAAMVKRPPGAARMLPLERRPAGLWKLAVPGARGLAEVSLDLKGRYLSGRAFSLRTQPIRVVLPVTEMKAVNLGLDGRPRLVTPAPVTEAAGQPPAPRGAATPPPAARLPDAALPPAEPVTVLPVWLAIVAALLNLGVGVTVWWLIGTPGYREEAQDMLAGLRRLAGIPEDAGDGSEEAPAAA